MIFDCFIFNDELDVLEMRLLELDAVVDEFVLSQASETFQGRAKPFFFNPNLPRWRRWAEKISVVQAELTGSNPWEREAQQREELRMRLTKISREDDLIMLSDVDEIPSRDTVRHFSRHSEIFQVAEMRLFCFAINLEHPNTWLGTAASKYRDITSIQNLRDTRGAAQAVKGGWHFSWLGNDSDNERKRSSFSHTEITPDQVSKARRRTEHLDGKLLNRVRADLEGDWPDYIRSNLFPMKWIKKEDGDI